MDVKNVLWDYLVSNIVGFLEYNLSVGGTSKY
jgi:hypothetical protein